MLHSNNMHQGDLQVPLLHDIKIHCIGYISKFNVFALTAKQKEPILHKLLDIVLATLICTWRMHKLMTPCTL